MEKTMTRGKSKYDGIRLLKTYVVRHVCDVTRPSR
jgi:hypothetical protein